MAFYPKKRPVLTDLIVDCVTEDEVSRYYSRKIQPSKGIKNVYEAEDFFPAVGEEGRWLFYKAAPLRDSVSRMSA